MYPENIIEQLNDSQWEVRTPKGGLLACIAVDPESGNYYVSEDFRCEAEFCGSRLEAFHYALTGTKL